MQYLAFLIDDKLDMSSFNWALVQHLVSFLVHNVFDDILRDKVEPSRRKIAEFFFGGNSQGAARGV